METVFEKAKRLGIGLAIKKMLGYEVAFSWGYRKRIVGKELYTGRGTDQPFIILPNTSRQWYANPAICDYEGNQVVYLQCMDRKTNVGCIASVRMTGDAIYKKKPHQVIIEPFPLSYPTNFEWNGSLYMLPETETANELYLYKCIDYPRKWIRAGRFLENYKIVSPVVTEVTDDSVMFIASEYDQGDPKRTRFVRFRFIRDDKGISAEWLGRDTDEYTYESRLAGPIIDNSIIPVQRSTPAVYGKSLKFMEWKDGEIGNEIVEILPEDIQYKNVRKKLIGVHSYCVSDEYELIDVEYLIRKKRFKNKRYWK